MNDGSPQRNLVVVGASAGGVEALQRLASGMPADFPAMILVVLHVPATSHSALPAILDRAGPLPARHARDGDSIEPGQILVAPPDNHLIVYDGAVTLSRGPRENGHRPAIDVLFRTAARAKGSRVVGVVLSGALDDGAAGMVAVAQRGGGCVVQAFEDALYESMPRAAMAAAPSATAATMVDMPAVLSDLLTKAPELQPAPASDLMEQEAAMAHLDSNTVHERVRPGVPSGFGCPDCHGALFEITEGPLVRYRCRVGHAWSAGSLVARQTVDLESALWMALRSLEEKAALTRELGDRAAVRGHEYMAGRFGEGADDVLRAAELLRELITSLGANETPESA